MHPPSFADIARSKYVSLTTFRRNAEPVRTPVWIAPGEHDQALYVFTGAGTGKIRRIQRNPRVELAPCAFRGRIVGPGVSGRAFVVPAAEHPTAERALTRKYPVAKRLLFAFNRLVGGHRPSDNRAYLRIELDAAGRSPSASLIAGRRLDHEVSECGNTPSHNRDPSGT